MLSSSILYCNKLEDCEPGESSRNASSMARSSQMSPRSSSTPISGLGVLDTSTATCQRAPGMHYRVQYLGSHTCDHRTHRLSSGLRVYQKPLLELYASVVRRSVVLRTISVISHVAQLSEHGIVIAQPSRQSAGQGEAVVTKVITPLSNILLWAAVKLQHRVVSSASKLKSSLPGHGKRKQVCVAFVPLSCSQAVLDNNAFLPLSSKQRFLLGLPHPPLVACVLQRVNSPARLECHLFVCVSVSQAISMCNELGVLRARGTSVGRLHVPSAMGPYSFSQSGAPSTSQSRNSQYSSLSEQCLSSVTYHHYFSDIEEEDGEGDDLNTARNKHLHSPARFHSSRKDNNQSRPQSSRANSHCKMADKMAPSPHELTSLSHEDFSLTELNSLNSSAQISTKSESKLSRKTRRRKQSELAQQDYRFQSFKTPLAGGPQTSKQKSEDNKARLLSYTSAKSKLNGGGNELQHNRLFAQASAKAAEQERCRTSTPSRENVSNEKTKAKSCEAQHVQRFFGDSLRGPKHSPMVPFHKNTPIQDVLGFEERDNSKSVMSSSIFFASEDKSSSDCRLTRSNSEDTVIYHYEHKPPVCVSLTSKTKSVPNLNKSDEPSVMLYLPDNKTTSSNSALGVKCFNKRTPVARWSTLASKSPPPPPSSRVPELPNPVDCELCCASLESLSPPSCPECCHLCSPTQPPDCMECTKLALPPHPLGPFHPSKINNKDQHDTLNSGSSFFSRIKRLTLRSWFSNSKLKDSNRTLNRWGRSGSQRLKGTRPFSFRKRVMPRREAASRIFLPGTPEANVYREPYLEIESKVKLGDLSSRMHGMHLSPSVPPFFISHPSRPIDPKSIETRISEFGQNHILSLSSDSGMEEFDCQSSTENSPTGHPHHLSAMVNYDLDPARNYWKAYRGVHHKDERRRGRDWSHTNMQHELGYIP